jgi:hypothetical protein
MAGWTATAGSLTYQSDGAHFTIDKRGDAPTIQTNAYLMFGMVEVRMKASSGQGIISSIVLQSDDLDEVDVRKVKTFCSRKTNLFDSGKVLVVTMLISRPTTLARVILLHTIA